MNNLKSVRMDDHNLLLALAGIISAFGVKEVWAIIQKKMDNCPNFFYSKC